MEKSIQEAGVSFLKEQRYPFLRITSLGVKPDDLGGLFKEYTKKISFTGWLVKYWPADSISPAAVACSPFDAYESGELDIDMLYGGSDDELSILSAPSDRNMSTQCFKTAGEVVLMVLEQGWTGVKIMEGSELMCWCIWAMCKVNGLTCEGYEPNDDNDAMSRYQRSEALLQAYDRRQPDFNHGLVLGAASGDDAVLFDFPEITEEDDF